MAHFGRRSLHRLRTCDPRLQRLFETVVRVYDCSVLEGHRGREAQNRAHREGKSQLQWPRGNHNAYPSKAADVAPYPIDWADSRRFYHFAGYVQATAVALEIPLRWGGDWDRDYDLNDQTFDDLVHFELDE